MSEDDKYYDYIQNLVEKGYISGFGDGTFRPYDYVTRSEFLKWLFLLSDTPLQFDETEYFSDIQVGWQKKYINTGVTVGVVASENTKFFPNNSISRVEALKMGIGIFNKPLSDIFLYECNDVCGTEWYAQYVNYSLENKIFVLENNYFFPNTPITRYEVIHLFYILQTQ